MPLMPCRSPIDRGESAIALQLDVSAAEPQAEAPLAIEPEPVAEEKTEPLPAAGLERYGAFDGVSARDAAKRLSDGGAQTGITVTAEVE